MTRKAPLIRIALQGACGRMGRQIAALALQDRCYAVSGALEAPDHPDLGKDYGAVLGRGTLGVFVSAEIPAGVDVVIDFSSPAATARHVRACATRRLPVVVGTTGLDATARKAVSAAARSVAVIQAPNMSVGVNALLHVLPGLLRRLGADYDIEIVEAHHRLKRDAPSGTAIELARVLAAATGSSIERDAVYGRRGDTGERRRGEIGIHALRAGDIAGDHRVIFAGPGEIVELVHRANSREPFARGALRAARFAAAARPGLYSMVDVLGQGD